MQVPTLFSYSSTWSFSPPKEFPIHFILYYIWLCQLNSLISCCQKLNLLNNNIIIIVCCVGGSKDFTMLYKAYCMANSAVCAYSTDKQCCMFIQHCWNFEILWSTHAFNKSVPAWFLLAFASCCMTFSTIPLVLYLSYSTRNHAITYT